MQENSSLIVDTGIREPDRAQDGPFKVFRLSWVAYFHESWVFLIRLVFCMVPALVLALGLDYFMGTSTMKWLPAVGVVLAVAWTTHSILFTKSVRLFTDEDGVWMRGGVFPWEKGVAGVLWRDVGEAGYKASFASWAMRSYDVRITNRFTTGSELLVPNVHRGNLAVEHVNEIMARLQGRVLSAQEPPMPTSR